MSIRILLSVLLLPPGNVLQLALLAPSKVFGILGLLQRMPIVQDPVRRDDLSLECTAANAVRNCIAEYELNTHTDSINKSASTRTLPRLVMLFFEQFALAVEDQLACHGRIGDDLVIVEACTHQDGMITENVSAQERNNNHIGKHTIHHNQTSSGRPPVAYITLPDIVPRLQVAQ